MQFPIIKKTNKLERIIILSVWIFLGSILGTAIGFIYPLVTGQDAMSLNSLRFMQITSQIFTFVLPPILYAMLVHEQPFKSLGFNKTTILWILISVIMTYTIMPLNSVFGEWNAGLKLPESMSKLEELMKSMQESSTELMEKFVNVDSIRGLIINLFMIAALAAIGEELLFRSIIQTSLIKICKNAHVGIIIASVIFSFIHLEFYGFLPRLIMGMILGYMFYYSRSIWIPMTIHFVNNGTIVFIYYLNNIGVTNIDVETFGQTNIPIMVSSTVVTIALLWCAMKMNKKESEPATDN